MVFTDPRVLSSGLIAKFEKHEFVPDSIQLIVDGTPQSHLNLADPTNLFYEYIRRMGNVIDGFRDPGKPINALHLGGGAYTLPRYIEATRPGSRQQVIEIDENLISLVREVAPLPKRASIRVRRGDARERISTLPGGLNGVIDLVVIDVFSGAVIPSHLTTEQFYESLKPLLKHDSIILINAADGPGLTFVRSQLATLRSLFEHTAAMADSQVLRGKRFGNIVLVASNQSINQIATRATALGPHPAALIQGEELALFVAGYKPVQDDRAVASPTPPRNTFSDK